MMDSGADISAQEALEVASGFLLDQIRVGRGLFDFVDALIIVAVTQANVEPILRDPELQRAYATYDAPPPEALRRPISVNALALSLRLPFETVRRRVARLSGLRVLKTGPSGVWTPGAQVRSPLHRALGEAGYGRLLALYARLRASSVRIEDLAHGTPWSGAPPLRAAARISSAYLLRFVDTLTAELGDPLDAAVWLEILRSNTAEADTTSSAKRRMRRPVRSVAVAARLGLPAETTRRRVAHLTSKSACEHTAGGLLISDETLSRPEFARVVARHEMDLRRMFAGLAELGALPRPDKVRLAA